MKTISKWQIFRQPDNACFMAERFIMSVKENVWLTKLEESFQDELFLYLVMEYFPGGDLSTFDIEGNGLDEDQVRFYAAEVVLALSELHSLGYIHRDVKPGNVMIREDGHIKLTDFGSSGKLNDQGLVWSRSSVGTPDYVSPEALLAQQSKNGASYGSECDWWGLGVFIFELLIGEPPFFAPSLVQTYANITNHKKCLDLKKHQKLSKDARDLLEGLLCDPERRLKVEEIMSHPFFSAIKWDKLCQTNPPFIPFLSSPEDTSRFYLDDEDDETFQNNFSKKSKAIFEGIQLPFVGWTHNPHKNYQVSWDKIPSLQRIASCQLRINELEVQMEEMKVNCETAKMVGQQIKKIASSDRIGNDSCEAISTLPTDELQAAYDALLQNYEFIQTHYEDLLMEHGNTSHQMQALIVTLQEQEESQKALQDEITELKSRSSLDKLKIQELVSKLTSIASSKQTLTSTSSTNSGIKEKQLLKQKNSEIKCLQQQLRQEEKARQSLEQELFEMTRAKESLEREHESLIVELKNNRIERRPSDVGLLRSIISRGHVRQASSISTMNCQAMEGFVKILDLQSSKKTLVWKKYFLSIRETGLWFGDGPNEMLQRLVDENVARFWARPIQPGELIGLPNKSIKTCFKFVFIAAEDDNDRDSHRSVKTIKTSELKSELIILESKIAKEQKILKGALHLLDAASTIEQQTIAQSHVDASQKMISDLESVCESIKAKIEACKAGEEVEVESINGDSHNFDINSDTRCYCDGCQKEITTTGLQCKCCNTRCHRECQPLIVFDCSEANRLANLVPYYVCVNSSEEARHWIRSLNHAFK